MYLLRMHMRQKARVQYNGLAAAKGVRQGLHLGLLGWGSGDEQALLAYLLSEGLSPLWGSIP